MGIGRRPYEPRAQDRRGGETAVLRLGRPLGQPQKSESLHSCGRLCPPSFDQPQRSSRASRSPPQPTTNGSTSSATMPAVPAATISRNRSCSSGIFGSTPASHHRKIRAARGQALLWDLDDGPRRQLNATGCPGRPISRPKLLVPVVRRARVSAPSGSPPYARCPTRLVLHRGGAGQRDHSRSTHNSCCSCSA